MPLYRADCEISLYDNVHHSSFFDNVSKSGVIQFWTGVTCLPVLPLSVMLCLCFPLCHVLFIFVVFYSSTIDPLSCFSPVHLLTHLSQLLFINHQCKCPCLCVYQSALALLCMLPWVNLLCYLFVFIILCFVFALYPSCLSLVNKVPHLHVSLFLPQPTTHNGWMQQCLG